MTGNAAPCAMAGLYIPPRPSILADLTEEIRLPAPSLSRLTELIRRDVGLAAVILRAVNSAAAEPAARVTSIGQAITTLGLAQVTHLIASNAPCLAVTEKTNALERFWDSAAETAAISRRLDETLGGSAPEDAYSAGLFLDCGIPLLMHKHADYKETLRLANAARAFVQPEEERHDTNHAVVGYFVCKSWKMPDILCQVVLHHHDSSLLTESSSLPEPTRRLIAITKLAEHVSNTYRTSKTQIAHQQRRRHATPEWDACQASVMEQLSLHEIGLHELLDDTLEWLQESA
mgnify:CR=1 FL=1